MPNYKHALGGKLIPAVKETTRMCIGFNSYTGNCINFNWNCNGPVYLCPVVLLDLNDPISYLALKSE